MAEEDKLKQQIDRQNQMIESLKQENFTHKKKIVSL